MPELSVSAEKVAFLIEKAREFDAKEQLSDPDSASNGTDDGMVDMLEEMRDDPAVSEFAGLFRGMSRDERIDIVALMRLGRGDGDSEDWDEIRAEAARGYNNHTLRYLLGEPLLGDLLAEGLAELGISPGDIEGPPESIH
jgi:hypothetical protein